MSDPQRPRVISKPWGREEIFAHTDRYAGKLLIVRAGESLSLQYHRHKDETLSVLSGRARLWVEENGALAEHLISPGDCFHIPPGIRHKLEAVEDTTMVEVSTPELDDVVRLEDRYGRPVETPGRKRS